MKTLKFFLWALAGGCLVGAAGCSKSAVDCFTSTGSIVRESRILPGFDSIVLNDNVNLILTCDSSSSNTVTVEAGENLMPGITTEVVNGQLVIHNRNTCNWVRSYDKPLNVYVSASRLWKISYYSAGDVTSTNTLRYDSLKVEAWEGCGTISLDLDLFSGYFIQHLGTADFRLRGVCQILTIYAGEYGPFNCSELMSNYCFLTTISPNDCRVLARRTLEVNIGSIGNVYYTGDPDTVKAVITGKGKLIKY
jgi:hypothetical protein